MRSLSLFCLLLLASMASAQAAQSPSQPPQNATSPSDSRPAQSAKPAASGPAVDEAKVTGGVFQSPYFKFTYQLPKDWKALDDAVRMAANKQAQEEETSAHPMPVRKRPANTKPASASPENASASTEKPMVPPPSNPLENYSLLVASPAGVTALNSVALPRVNVWAKRRIPPLDHVEDPAMFMIAMRYAKVIVKPQHLTFDGHDFVRADIQTPTGDYRTQFVTIVGDYLIGFEFHASSQAEGTAGIDSMKTVKFQ
jgi:hypothetical protein